MDFMMLERHGRCSSRMRGGLAWLDAEWRDRFGRRFVATTDAERRALLDDIAWPARAKPELSHGVAFFTRSATYRVGFWSSQIGSRICSIGATRSCPNGTDAHRRRWPSWA